MSNIRPELLKAVALHYDGSGAPKIIAKGEGAAAEEIKTVAGEHDVPVCDNAPLAEVLSSLEIGEAIPQSVYLAVAHIIAFAYKIRAVDLGAEQSQALKPPAHLGPYPPQSDVPKV